MIIVNTIISLAYIKRSCVPLYIIILHMCTKNYDHMMYWLNGRMEEHTKVGAPPKNLVSNPAGTRRCNNVRFWLYSGRDVR